MSTWSLLPDSSGDCFRWEVAGRVLQSDSEDSATESTAPLPSTNDLLLQGWSKLKQGDGAMFRTGLGNSVALKAKSILADEHHHHPDGGSNLQSDSAATLPMFRTASGRSVPLKDSSIAKALSILGPPHSADNVPLRESGFGDPNSFFQTPSNNMVIVDDFTGFNHVKRSNQKRGCSELKTHATGVLHHSETPGQYEGHVFQKISESLYPSAVVPPTMFQTAGGKTLSVSVQALKRARNLLGDPDSVTLFDDVPAVDQFSTPQKVQRLGDLPINNRNANTGYNAFEGKTSNKHTATSFVSPLRSSSKQFRSVKLEDLASGGNLIKKFDAAVDDTDRALNTTKLATHGVSNNRPMAVNNAKANGFIPIAKQSGQPLVDITNRSANNKQDSTQKKRLGKTIFVSPFKKPRNSSFKTPLKKNAQHALSGLSIVSSDTLNSKKVLSTRYPERSPRVYIKDYFRMHPTVTTKEALGSGSGSNVKVELSDGWYSMNAALDVNLTKQLNAGKLFVGQKLRHANVLISYLKILGAGLSGWATPTSPLEAVISNTICLLLNINGTYRAHWADRLGFCKEVGAPLAFNCIKGNGGPVPKTLAGITRIYPILYKERRSALIEGLMCEYERGGNGVHSQNDTDSEEGAKVFKLLETASEPELLMAEMSLEQLTSFTTYKSKFEAAKQIQMEKSVAQALEEAGLSERDVTPFMRIRLVGLTSLSYEGVHNPKEGIVTIWNPTERQRTELTEGKIYIMKGLVPTVSDSETLYLHARGSSSRWEPLSPKASSSFQPFFNPRKPISLSIFGGIPLSSEFDIAAYVVYVGNVYTDVEQKKQWVFVTDGSTQRSRSGEISNSLLAISFSTPSMDDLPTPHISHSLVGSVVGFCNLIKRAKDAKNNMWVGEATENSVYSINAEAAYSSHLKTSSSHIQTWAKLSSFNSVLVGSQMFW
ncbi:hypothetical protein YC2023_033827 [Brassica napus]